MKNILILILILVYAIIGIKNLNEDYELWLLNTSIEQIEFEQALIK